MATNIDKALYQQPQGIDKLGEQEEALEIEIIDHGDGPDVVLRTERWALAGKEDLQRFVDVLSDLIDKVQDKRISRNN